MYTIRKQFGYSVWALTATIAILAVLGVIMIKKVMVKDQMPHQVSYLPTDPAMPTLTDPTVGNTSHRAS